MKDELLKLYLDWIVTRDFKVPTTLNYERVHKTIGKVTVEEVLSKNNNAYIVIVRHAMFNNLFDRLIPLVISPSIAVTIIAKQLGFCRETVYCAIIAYVQKLKIKDTMAVETQKSLEEYLLTVEASKKTII